MLSVRTRRLPEPVDLLSWLPSGLARDQVFAWVRGGDGLVGWGRAAAIRTGGPERMEAAQEWWAAVSRTATVEDRVGGRGCGLVGFGSFAFAGHSPAGGSLVVPRILLGRLDGHTWVTTCVADGSPDRHGRLREEALDSQPGSPLSPGEVAFSDGALTGPAWQSAVGEAVARIGAGEVDKVVLARDLVVETGAAIDPRWLLRRLAAEYDKTWVFSVDGLVGATPELLVRRERGLVTSRILAGTIRRTGDDARDLALAASLARSSKDLEEHEYAVRSVREALAPLCTSMNVPDSPFVLHLPNVMHLATDVTGRLIDGESSLHLAAALHPSAAVGGTPTETAVRVIAELEGMDRGRYAGPVGWMDAHGDGEFGIALRCGAIEKAAPNRIRLFAGCGIVAGSDPAAEVEESEAKLLAMRHALSSD